MSPALLLGLKTRTSNQQSVGWTLRPPNATSRDQHHTRLAVLMFPRHHGMFGRSQLLPPGKERARPGLPHAFHPELDAFQILYNLWRALGQEGIHIPIYFLRDNVLPFILCQAFYLQLASFIYLIFTCYVSDLIVRNGISTLGVLWIWSSRRGRWSSCCVHLFPVAS